MRQLVIVLMIIIFCITCAPIFPVESPPIDLITLERRWAETWGNGHAPKSDEVKDGRKCWHVKDFDFHGQQTWQAWRCVVIEGPAIGTIQWEWRNPKGG